MAMKVGVIAGSQVDTQMGVEVLNVRGIETYAYPAAKAAREQTEFQMQSSEVRTNRIQRLIQSAQSDGMNAMMIYCNSLSSTVDMEMLSRKLGIKIVTPLMAYACYAKQYQVLSVLAGNNQGLAGIERAILQSNLSCTVVGASLLPMVVEIEAQTLPEQIVEKFHLMSLFEFFESAGAEAFILGCTHFPYIRRVLDEKVRIPILDPADKMYELLVND